MPNICYGHFRAGNCHVIDIDRQRVALGRAERRDLGPHIVIAIICQDRAEGTARRQMTLERAKITKNAGNVGAASHDALEERDHPHTGRVGEELLDVEAVNDAVAAMARGIADVASSLHRRSEEHTSELQSLMRISYAVFCLKKKKEKTKK